jgi:hypothetical protein
MITQPAGNASVLNICGSLCQSLYSPAPAGLPGTATADDGGPSSADASSAGGDASEPRAVCVAGQTGATQYDLAGMALQFAFSGVVPDGGPELVNTPNGYMVSPPPALIDASQYAGIQFWLWVSPDTVAGVTSGFEACLYDKWNTPGAVATGGCDPSSQGATACGSACADIAQSTAALSQGAGALLDPDGGMPSTLSGGWQLVKAPWANFVLNPYYGGAIEPSVDPTSLTQLSIWVQQDLDPDAGMAPIAIDFCVYDVAFYR